MFLEALKSKKSVERLDFKVFFQPKNIRFIHENKLVSCVRARVVYGFLHTNDDPESLRTFSALYTLGMMCSALSLVCRLNPPRIIRRRRYT